MAYRLTRLEQLQDEALLNNIDVKYAALPKRIKALFYSEPNIPAHIAINKHQINTAAQETCLMAEELGHYYTSSGNLLTGDIDKTIIGKQEEQARRWAVKRIASLKDFVSAFEDGCRTKEELADYLNITGEFLSWSINYYKNKFGLMTIVDKEYIVYFEPFGILKMFVAEGTIDNP